MKKKVISNISKLILTSLLLTSCNSKKDFYFNKEIKYQDDLYCLYKYSSRSYEDYDTFSCLSEKYGFKSEEFKKFNKIYNSFLEGQSDSNKFVAIETVIDDNLKLSDNNNYGIYKVMTLQTYPNFYFLRTADEVVFFSCKEKNKYEIVLDKSNMDSTMKENIVNFINNKCETGDLVWYSGNKFD